MDTQAELIKTTDTNMIALKKFFGFKPGQTLKEFAAEVRELSPESQQELGDLIRAQCGR
jgi:hypothetical protein